MNHKRPPRPVVIIQDGVLLSMAASLNFRQQFPFLQALQQQHGRQAPHTCSSCSRKQKQASNLYTRAKESLASLPPHKQQQLKTLLNAEKIRIHWIDANGNKQERTF